MRPKPLIILVLLVLFLPIIAGCNSNEEQTKKIAPFQLRNETDKEQNVTILIKDATGAITFNDTGTYPPESLTRDLTHLETPGKYTFVVTTDTLRYDNTRDFDTAVEWIRMNIRADRITLTYQKV